MKPATRKIGLNSRAPAGLRRAAWRTPKLVSAATLLSRHGAWSRAIANRRGATSRLGWHPESFIFWFDDTPYRTQQQELQSLLQLHFSSSIRNVFLAPVSRVYQLAADGRMRMEQRKGSTRTYDGKQRSTCFDLGQSGGQAERRRTSADKAYSYGFSPVEL